MIAQWILNGVLVCIILHYCHNGARITKRHQFRVNFPLVPTSSHLFMAVLCLYPDQCTHCVYPCTSVYIRVYPLSVSRPAHASARTPSLPHSRTPASLPVKRPCRTFPYHACLVLHIAPDCTPYCPRLHSALPHFGGKESVIQRIKQIQVHNRGYTGSTGGIQVNNRGVYR